MASIYWNQFYEIKSFLLLLPLSKDKIALEKKCTQLEEDLELTQKSFNAKNSIQDKKIVKITRHYADHCYRSRLIELCKALIPLFYKHKEKELVQELSSYQLKLQEGLQFSFHYQEPFKNPYPSYLFFSQNFHANHFSNKSQREGVSSETLTEVIEKLKKEELKEDYLRVQIFFAPYKEKIHPFTYNNRTWVVFSQAKQHPSRIVPILPTQDLLNRIRLLDPASNPNLITKEEIPTRDTPLPKSETQSLLPGPHPRWR